MATETRNQFQLLQKCSGLAEVLSLNIGAPRVNGHLTQSKFCNVKPMYNLKVAIPNFKMNHAKLWKILCKLTP